MNKRHRSNENARRQRSKFDKMMNHVAGKALAVYRRASYPVDVMKILRCIPPREESVAAMIATHHESDVADLAGRIDVISACFDVLEENSSPFDKRGCGGSEIATCIMESLLHRVKCVVGDDGEKAINAYVEGSVLENPASREIACDLANVRLAAFISESDVYGILSKLKY